MWLINKLLKDCSRAKLGCLVLAVLVLAACGGGGSGGSSGQVSGDTGGTGAGGTTDTATTDDADDSVTATGVRIGNGTGASFVEGVVGASETNLLAGETVTLTVNFVDLNSDALGAQVSVDLTSACFATGIASFGATSITTNSGGLGTTSYTSSGCSGEDEIIATASVDGEVLTATVTLTIEPDNVLGVSYEGASTTQLSLQGTGGTETSILTFRLVGAQGANIIGEAVTFTITGDEGDATLAEGTETATSGLDGTVTTVLQSGTVATNIRVTATHDATQISGQSDSIVISSGLPIQAGFSLTQSSFNPANTFDTDGISVSVSILADDQFGNNITPGTQVSFLSECGIIEPFCTIDADSGCSVTWRSNTADQDDGDFRCSILAFTEGVESFTDLNGNFVYEDSDIFDVPDADLPEPWVDNNENGVFDLGEAFIDTATGNAGAYDQGNGEWDGLCLIGAVPTANCDGEDSAVIFGQGLITITCDIVTVIASPASGSTIDLTAGDTPAISLFLEDGCTPGNPPAAGTSISFSSDAVEFSGGESDTVDNQLTTPIVTGVGFRADDTPGTGEIELSITPPGGDTLKLFWIVID